MFPLEQAKQLRISKLHIRMVVVGICVTPQIPQSIKVLIYSIRRCQVNSLKWGNHRYSTKHKFVVMVYTYGDGDIKYCSIMENHIEVLQPHPKSTEWADILILSGSARLKCQLINSTVYIYIRYNFVCNYWSTDLLKLTAELVSIQTYCFKHLNLCFSKAILSFFLGQTAQVEPWTVQSPSTSVNMFIWCVRMPVSAFTISCLIAWSVKICTDYTR